MFNDAFKARYDTIPFATSYRNHKKNTVDKNIVSISHNHKEFEVMCILKGTAQMNINSQSYPVKQGDIVIIPPYLLHNTIIFSDCDFRHYCMCFDMEIIHDTRLKDNAEKGRLKIPFVVKENEKASKQLSSLLKEAFKANEKKKTGWELKIIGNLTVFFALLLENNYICEKNVFSEYNHFCSEILEFIEDNYDKDITTTDTAKKFYISESFFCRKFKKIFGISFQNYICMYRIEKAKVLLKTTEISISEIALLTGFNSFSYFGKMFKEYSNMTPSQYKKSTETKNIDT